MCKSWSHVDYLCCIVLSPSPQQISALSFYFGGWWGGLMALLRVKENVLIKNVRDQLYGLLNI